MNTVSGAHRAQPAADALTQLLRRAADEGVLAGATPPSAGDERPWPVVLLTALGAWLAAIPLLAVVAMLLGDLISAGVGPYLVGLLVLAGAVVVLRAHAVALFVEQLAVPALLVGGGSLGFGLFRDLPDRAAALALALVALVLAGLLARAWLRVLLGAVAAGLALIALTPVSLFDGHASASTWLAAHALLVLWLAALWLQQAHFNHGAGARWAMFIESTAAGWLLALLAIYAALSGMSFLVGASMGGMGGLIGEIARRSGERSVLLPALLAALSVALALAAAGLAQRHWPSLRQAWYLAAGLLLAVLAWFLPALGAVLLVLALTAVTRRALLATAAGLGAAWIGGSFYYYLEWELATKALVLVALAAGLGALAWVAHRATRPDATATGAQGSAAQESRLTALVIALTAAVTLAVANYAIWQKETLIARGQPIFVELAPVDPRSLMQGDFMRLHFRLPPELDSEFRYARKRPQVLAIRDQRGVATIAGLYRGGSPLRDNELRIELTPKDGRWVFVTDAWFFREGDAARWEAARYGEFRVDASGKALLVGMADAQLRPIGR